MEISFFSKSVTVIIDMAVEVELMMKCGKARSHQ